jgi:hypothetical protein
MRDKLDKLAHGGESLSATGPSPELLDSRDERIRELVVALIEAQTQYLKQYWARRTAESERDEAIRVRDEAVALRAAGGRYIQTCLDSDEDPIGELNKLAARGFSLALAVPFTEEDGIRKIRYVMDGRDAMLSCQPESDIGSVPLGGE